MFSYKSFLDLSFQYEIFQVIVELLKHKSRIGVMICEDVGPL